jgi:hypothetical protein
MREASTILKRDRQSPDNRKFLERMQRNAQGIASC